MRILITGATDGIGKETARQLARQGHSIVMVGRDNSKSRAALAEVQAEAQSAVDLLTADLAEMESVSILADEVKDNFPDLQVLINNAAVIRTERIVTSDGLEETFAVNYLSHFLLTYKIIEILRKNAPSRIVNVSSMVHESGSIDFEDLQSERSYNPSRAYAQSKVAMVLFTRELHNRFFRQGVSANSLHPGVIKTKLLHVLFSGGAAVEKGAQTTVYLAASQEVDGGSGRYYVDKQPAHSKFLEGPDNKSRRLWEKSEELLAQFLGGSSRAGV
jgi:NAD(P)-dependent dehydrogenase (short-subunit alcohol dehydrogenase family)